MASIFIVNELSSAKYVATVKDEGGVPFGAFQTLTLTLYNRADRAIINGRNAQNVLNTNQVTVNGTTGELIWNLLPTDNPIINDALGTEEHRALFVGTWASGAKQVTHEIPIGVVNLRRIP